MFYCLLERLGGNGPGQLFLLSTAIAPVVLSVWKVVRSEGSTRVWEEFVESLRKDELTPDKIRPYDDRLKETLMEYLKMIRENALWEKFEAAPEIHRVGDQVHYLFGLTSEQGEMTWCFTFLIEEGNWYFQHLENISIRLDKISSFPTSTFPDLPQETKAWMREEILWSDRVRLFNLLAKEKGKDFAFNWFRDGRGYFLAAKSWVPFVPKHKAFILYLCWEQAKLRGNSVTLEKISDHEATVKLNLVYFKLYKTTAHLKQQISFEDYRRIFETIWQDRASKAGWKVQIRYEGEESIFHFERRP